MQADTRFTNQDKQFWAHVRILSQALGYTDKRSKQIRIYTFLEMQNALSRLGLSPAYLEDIGASPSAKGLLLQEYFEYRSRVLNSYVEPRLMEVERAKSVFYALQNQLNSVRPVPMNKQSGIKKAPAYLTGIVNLLIEAYAEGLPCDYDPAKLTTVTKNSVPLRTLARRLDGCFPSCINPIAGWEIKEYYYTTTFGSRVADGIYESLLDGLELEELREHEGVKIQHLLIVDAHYTWWVKGRSYLCRIIDMLNMGYLDEVLFGYEVIERMPEIVKKWVEVAKEHY